MTLREWTIAYLLQFGRERLRLAKAEGEQEFIMSMIADLERVSSKEVFNVYCLLSEEVRRMEHERQA